jgi:hypothetical protein
MIISLKNLNEATAQQVFDQVVDHLRKQGVQSKNHTTGFCLYRYGALKCAAGCLIADDEYTPMMDGGDGGTWSFLTIAIKGFPTAHVELIQALQRLHDSVNPEYWEEAFRDLVARGQYDITYKID